MSKTAQEYEVRAGLATVEAFDVAGISIITSSETATDDINALWEKFFTEQIGQKLQHKADDVIYAVYSDYVGDHTKPYRITLGYRTKGEEPDLHHVQIIPQEYAVMSAAGQQPKALIETWEAIWSSDIGRSFKTDFELYGPRFFEQGLHEVLVHVGIETA